MSSHTPLSISSSQASDHAYWRRVSLLSGWMAVLSFVSAPLSTAYSMNRLFYRVAEQGSVSAGQLADGIYSVLLQGAVLMVVGLVATVAWIWARRNMAYLTATNK